MEINYLAVDVVIDQNEDGYFVRIRNAPTGEAVAAFQAPFSPSELERLHRFVTTGEAFAVDEEAQNAT